MSGSINRLGIENTQKITDSRAASFKQKPPKFQYSALLFFEYSSYFEEGNIVITYSKQGYAFKNWVEGLSDEAQSSRLAENCIFSLVSSNLPFDISLLSTFHRNAQFESKRRILKKVPCQK